jgi:hypothetical protein
MGRIRAATTTCSTAETTTTTSSASARGRRPGPLSSPCRSSRSPPTAFPRSRGARLAPPSTSSPKPALTRRAARCRVFGQDADWTATDYFAKERNLSKPDTKRTEFGGTIGGPIVKDKAHFFFSLERVMIDRGAAIVIPARPDLNWSPTTQDRVWNTMVKFDQQLNANHTWGVRWLRELSPQRNQAIKPPLITSVATREEDDKDQTVLATFSSVFGSMKLNSLRVGWTQEDVAFANPCFNGNGRDLTLCDPTLSFQTFTDQQDNTAQARVNDAYQVEDTFSWFLPNKHGDHDVKFGAQFEFVNADNFGRQHERDVRFGASNAPDANNPRTYPTV